MPTILNVGPYRLFFVAQDLRERMVAKYWLDPVALEKAGGFRPHELNLIGKLVQERSDFLLERWNEYFGN